MESKSRLVRHPDGSYTWNCQVDKKYHWDSFRFTIRMLSMFFLLVLLVSAFLSWKVRNWEFMGIIGLYIIAVMMIIIIVFMILAHLPGSYYESYHLTDSYVKTGSGRSSSMFFYDGIKVLIIRKTYLQLNGRFRRFKVFVPEADMSFVKNYIMGRMPGDAEIRYQVHDNDTKEL